MNLKTYEKFEEFYIQLKFDDVMNARRHYEVFDKNFTPLGDVSAYYVTFNPEEHRRELLENLRGLQQYR